MANRTLRRAKPRDNKPVVIGIASLDENRDESERGTVDGDGSNADTPSADNGSVDDDAEPVTANVGTGYVEVDPSELDDFIAADRAATGAGDDNSSGTRKRKPRTDAGTKRGRRTKTSPPSVDAIVLVHTMASIMLKTPELALEKAEAQQLANGLSELQKHFDIPVPNEKAVAIMAMVAIAGQVYGTRIMAITARKKMEKQKARTNVTPINVQQPQPQTVTQMG